MKFTLSWLKEYLETDASAEQIAEQLTSLGLVVDSWRNPAQELKDFTIAQITSVAPHPDADKLQVCQVDTGSEMVSIVCGAANARAGLKTVLARAGTKIPASGIVLKQTKIRGIESCGMLCSSAELGLAESAEGIIELEEAAPVGKNYAHYAGLDDPIFEIEITSNRGDCLGVVGVARDLSATGIGHFKPADAPTVTSDRPAVKKITLDFKAAEQKACPHFVAREIRGLKNGPSPLWLQHRLRAIGLRPISTLVDITNYMAFTFCRPMHVFDLDKVQGDLMVRKAEAGETIMALDERIYTLDPTMTVITDSQHVLSIAGIMGGQDSGCTEATTNVLLESAFFDPVHTAMTGRALGILSDARHRFERGVDPSIVESCLEIATQMIVDLCGGEPSTVIKAGAYQAVPKVIDFDPKLVKGLGGMCVARDKILKILRSLGFTVNEQDAALRVTVPAWRFDVQGAADLVEEICRVVGYDHIIEEAMPAAKPEEAFESTPGLRQNIKRRDLARQVLAARGLCEVQTWSFLDRKKAGLFGTIDPQMIISNPISQELEIMRPSLLANLVAGAGRNHDRGIADSALFEVGAAYGSSFKAGQEMRIAGIRSGVYADRHWLNKERPVDVFDIKADFYAVLEACGINVQKIQTTLEAPAWYHPGRSGTVMQGPKTVLGTFGELHPQVLKELDVEGVVVGFEVYLDRLPLVKETTHKKPLQLSSLQPVYRDFAFIVDQTIPAEKIVQAAQKVDRHLIADIAVFDVYQGAGIPEGKKSLAFTVTFTPYDKTLTDDEINRLMDHVIIAVGQETGGELRT
jgi:phenylalanyl-tRNA synthetase, beta subunit, non-spirochete bacterial